MRQLAVFVLFFSFMGPSIFGDSVDLDLAPSIVQIQCAEETGRYRGFETIESRPVGMGVLIAPQVVLTGAGNLMDYSSQMDSRTPVDCALNTGGKTGLKVVRELGNGDIAQWVAAWTIHDGFRFSSGSLSPAIRQNNVSLLFLTDGYSEEIDYPELADWSIEDSYLEAGVEATTVTDRVEWGWAELSQHTDLITDKETCQRRMWRVYAPFIHSGTACWGVSIPTNIRRHDYGAPLLVNTGDSWAVIGVLSTVAENPMNGFRAGIFGRVAPFHDWLDARIDGDVPTGDGSPDSIQAGELVRFTYFSQELVGFVASVLDGGSIDVAAIEVWKDGENVELLAPVDRGNRIDFTWADVRLRYYANVPHESSGEPNSWRRMTGK